jgi:hypothetical protein
MKQILIIFLFIPFFVNGQFKLQDLLKNFSKQEDNGSSFMLYHNQHDTESSWVYPQLTINSKTGKIEMNLWSGNKVSVSQVRNYRQVCFGLGEDKVKTPFVSDEDVTQGDYVFNDMSFQRFEQIIFDSNVSIDLVEKIVKFHRSNPGRHIYVTIKNQNKEFTSILGYREVMAICDTWDLYQLWNPKTSINLVQELQGK